MGRFNGWAGSDNVMVVIAEGSIWCLGKIPRN